MADVKTVTATLRSRKPGTPSATNPRSKRCATKLAPSCGQNPLGMSASPNQGQTYQMPNTMNVAVHVIKVPETGSPAPTMVDTGSGGMAVVIQLIARFLHLFRT